MRNKLFNKKDRGIILDGVKTVLLLPVQFRLTSDLQSFAETTLKKIKHFVTSHDQLMH